MLDEFQFIYKQGSWYIGGFIGATACLAKWVDDQVKSWVGSIKLPSKAAKQFPQTSFAALTCSLQTEWTYLQQVVPDVAPSFAPIEEVLAKSFLPALFGGKAPPRNLTSLPVRFGGLGIPNPCTQASHHFDTSKEMTEGIIASLRENNELNTVVYRAHSSHLLRGRRHSQEVDLKNLLDPILNASPKFEARRINKRSQNTECGSQPCLNCLWDCSFHG